MSKINPLSARTTLPLTVSDTIITIDSDDEKISTPKRPRENGDTPPRLIKKALIKCSPETIERGLKKVDEKSKEARLEQKSEISMLFREPKDEPSQEVPDAVIKIDSQLSQNQSDNDETMIDDFDDEFDDDMFESLSMESQNKYPVLDQPFSGRGKVVDRGYGCVIVEQKGKFYELKVKDEWYLHEGDIVHSAPTFGSVPIAHSDTLVSCTAVAQAASCEVPRIS